MNSEPNINILLLRYGVSRWIDKINVKWRFASIRGLYITYSSPPIVFGFSDDLQTKEIEVWEYVLKWSLEKNPILLPDPTTCKPNNNILLPRNRIINGIIDSRIVNLNIVSLVSRWIDKIDIKSKYVYARKLYLPHEFKLLLKGSRDGYTPKKIHELCEWKSDGGYVKTKDSFIFSFKNKDSFKDPILSYVKNYDKALCYNSYYGPTFDLILQFLRVNQIQNIFFLGVSNEAMKKR
ncbi:hypothetical protein RhiirC2_794349 [Rhizophagus irregularis]|uniref:TLDc domain-containing protein n=1 Tax=Rhizophagus irregularis TaxID=588596 RepID=A0A2N1MDQ3_9GLOM|nr:hypothetical protein RhiirC2_794349 [Rhizophagus irregularis]